MHPAGGASFLERHEALDGLGFTEAGLHADPVVQPEVGIEARLDHRPRPRRRAATLREHLPCLVEELVVRHHPCHHSPVLRLGRGQCAAGEHEVARPHRADQPCQHVAVVRVGDSAVQLRHPERRTIADHGHVTAHRDLQPAALAQPVHRGHHRLRRLPQRLEGRDVHAERRPVRQPVVGAAAAHVATRREHVAGSGDEQARQIGIGVDVADGVPDPEVHGGRHRVARLRAVQGAHAEGAFPREAQERRAQPVAFRRTWGVLSRGGHGTPHLS